MYESCLDSQYFLWMALAFQVGISLILFGCKPSELIVPTPPPVESKSASENSSRIGTEGSAIGAVAAGAVVGYLAGGKRGALVGAAAGAYSRPLPTYSVWTTFHERGAELREFGMYTYVLFGSDVLQMTAADPLVYKRYESLLKEITGIWQYEQFSEVLKKEDVNLFCVPVKSTSNEGRPKVSFYNFDLARLYLARLGGALIADKETALRFLTKPGPFLVSTLSPIPELKSEENYLLYSDLSEMNPSAMSEIVKAYRQRVHSRAIASSEPFHPFRVRLLSIILDADNNVGLVKASIISWFSVPPPALAK
jgi:hypothetical protein